MIPAAACAFRTSTFCYHAPTNIVYSCTVLLQMTNHWPMTALWAMNMCHTEDAREKHICTVGSNTAAAVQEAEAAKETKTLCLLLLLLLQICFPQLERQELLLQLQRTTLPNMYLRRYVVSPSLRVCLSACMSWGSLNVSCVCAYTTQR